MGPKRRNVGVGVGVDGGGGGGGTATVYGLGSKAKKQSRNQVRSQRLTLLLLLAGGALVLFGVFLLSQHLTSGPTDTSTAKAKKWRLSDEQILGLAGQTSMRRFKNALLEPLMTVRPVGSENHKLARQHIVSTLEELGWHVEVDTFMDSTPLGRKRFYNIIATWDPHARQRVVFAAHYESKLFVSGPHKNFIGATDSAVPCAMLLDMAHTLTPHMQNRRRALGTTAQLVFFDGEEAFENWTNKDSTYGARHLASKWAATRVVGRKGKRAPTMLDTIECLVLMDLLGTKNPTMHSAFPKTRPLHSRMAEIEGRLHALGAITSQPKSFFNTDYSRRAPMVEDDHIPFLRRGVPILHLITVPFPATWHTAGDNADILHDDVMENWLAILRVFAAEYLHIDPTDTA